MVALGPEEAALTGRGGFARLLVISIAMKTAQGVMGHAGDDAWHADEDVCFGLISRSPGCMFDLTVA